MDFVHDPPAEYIQQLTSSTVFQGDASTILKKLPAQVFRCCISSPPYWGLRDYSVAEQIGAEEEPADYIQRLVAVFEEVRRVLRDDATLWLNVGDFKWVAPAPVKRIRSARAYLPKDLVGIPWRTQDDYLRSDIRKAELYAGKCER